tara:strand:- start:41 stop:817 length:777 start_codon:yes stop_codon:yes gene_type:complete
MVKYIVTIIGYPRTGTNFLLCFIRKYFPHFNVNFEIFNPQKCFMNEDYIQEILDSFILSPSMANENKLVNLAHTYPFHFINQLRDIGKEEILIYKIFPEHLPEFKVRKLLLISDLVIFNERNFVDTFISLVKAKEQVRQNIPNPWIKVDTTPLKIHFDSGEYELEKETHDSWFNKNMSYVREKNIPFVRLNYESFHKLNILEKQKMLQGIWLKYFPEKLTIMLERDSELLEKQDRSQKYQDKISNYLKFNSYFQKEKN